jgi:hypothetical protein
MDVLSTAFRTKEHAAHARVGGNLNKAKRSITVLSTRLLSSQYCNKVTMPLKVPLTMVKKSA